MENIGSAFAQNRPEYPGCRITERPLYISCFVVKNITLFYFVKVNVTPK